MNDTIRGRSIDNRFHFLKVGEDGEIFCILCATQADGTITPLQCDASGKLLVTSS